MADDNNTQVDPQKLVDEALTPSNPSQPAPVIKEDTPPEEPEPAEPSVPSELLGSTAAQDEAPPLAGSEAETEPEKPGVSMGDETPLAFAGAAATPTTPTPSTETPPEPAMPAPSATPTGGPKFPDPTKTFVPPVASTTAPLEEPKKKGKLGKVLAIFVGLMLLVGAVAGGYWYYTNYYGETPQIAVLDQACYDRCRVNKGHQVCTCECGGECTRPDSSGDSGSGAAPIVQGPQGVCYTDNNRNGYDPSDAGYGFFCGGCVNQCVSTQTLNAAGGGCNAYITQQCGGTTIGGVSCTDDQATATANNWTKTCGWTGVADQFGNNGSSCGGTTVWFSTTGQCVNEANNGLCATYPGCKVPTVGSGGNGTGGTGYECDGLGCRLTTGTLSGSCFVRRYTCEYVAGQDTSGGCQDNPSSPAAGYSFSNQKCTVEQIDATCNGSSNFVTKTNTDCDEPSEPPSAPPSAPPAPTLACTGLTKNLADTAIKVGSTVEFTCTGASSPAGAVDLTYQFRYRIDSGAWTTLSATGAKASYEIEEVGDYDVQCRACGSLQAEAKQTCDPIWSVAQ